MIWIRGTDIVTTPTATYAPLLALLALFIKLRFMTSLLHVRLDQLIIFVLGSGCKAIGYSS